MEKNELFRLILSIIICQMAGIIGSIFTASSVASWYPTLVKPAFAPPGLYIGLIWIVLFTLMGISLFLIWRETPSNLAARIALNFFAAQLIVNVLWSVAFFSMLIPEKRPDGHRLFMGLDSHYDYQVLAYKPYCCTFADSLYHLGELCCILELLHLEIESLRGQNHGSRHLIDILLAHSRSLWWLWRA